MNPGVVLLLIKKDLHRKSAFIVFAVLSVIMMMPLGIAGFLGLLKPALLIKKSVSLTGDYFSLILYGVSLISFGLYINVFTAQVMVKEKSSRIIESIMATALTAKRYWLTASLAVFIPGLIITITITAITAILLAFWLYINNSLFLISGAHFLPACIYVPIIFALLSFAVIGVGLIGDGISGNVIAQILLPSLGSPMLNIGARNIIPLHGDISAVIHLCVAGALILLLMITGPMIIPERIILSGRKN